MGDEARNVVAGLHNEIQRPTRGEVTFLIQTLQQLLPTIKNLLPVEMKGRSCIIDEKRRPQNGDTVLLDMSGMYE